MNELKVFHLETNLLFRSGNRLQPGRVKVVLCQYSSTSTFGANYIFVLANNNASPINFIEEIAIKIQNNILSDLGMSLKHDFRTFIITYFDQLEKKFISGDELVEPIFSDDLKQVVDWKHLNFHDLNFSKEDFSSSLNMFLSKNLSPYQSFIVYSSFLRSETNLMKILNKLTGASYIDHVFKLRVEQAFLSFVDKLEKEQLKSPIDIGTIISRLSSLSISDKSNSGCYAEIGDIAENLDKDL